MEEDGREISGRWGRHGRRKRRLKGSKEGRYLMNNGNGKRWTGILWTLPRVVVIQRDILCYRRGRAGQRKAGEEVFFFFFLFFLLIGSVHTKIQNGRARLVVMNIWGVLWKYIGGCSR